MRQEKTNKRYKIKIKKVLHSIMMFFQTVIKTSRFEICSICMSKTPNTTISVFFVCSECIYTQLKHRSLSSRSPVISNPAARLQTQIYEPRVMQTKSGTPVTQCKSAQQQPRDGKKQPLCTERWFDCT